MWWQAIQQGLAQDGLYVTITKAVLLVAVAWMAYSLTTRIVLRFVLMLFKKSKNTWDDVLVKNRVVHAVSHLVPAVVVYYGAFMLQDYKDGIHKVVNVYSVIIIVLILDRLLSCGMDLYQSTALSKRRPLKGYFQLAKMFVFIMGAVFVFSLVLNKSPWGLLSGVGAMTAVLMLVFKDTILSFVAGMQLAGNDLIHKGDWIEMPSLGADGDVVDVALHTVKVQNFDKTIVAIPTHKFMDNAFKNWRGMEESGGRRIKRCVYIDQSSIGFCDEQTLNRLRKVHMLTPYIERKLKDIDENNTKKSIDTAIPMNGRQLTNIGLFRAYALEYLKQHPRIHRHGKTLLVRQLQPESSKGLPIELYCFTKDTAWGSYEDIQSDIFDHLLAAIPEFGLRAYQRNALADKRGAVC